MSQIGSPTAQEIMVVVAAREIRDSELVFVGMRLPLLAFALAQATHARSAVGLYENGVIRTEAAPTLLHTMSDPPNIEGALRTGEMLEVMGLLQSGQVGLGFVGAAEVDRFGNLNTTWVRNTRLPGSGGACDIASLADRLVVLVPHQKHRLVDNVHYRTSPGYGNGRSWRREVGLPRGGPEAVITDRGVLRFDPRTKEAVLVSFHPLPGTSSPADVVNATGWPLKVDRACGPTPLPTSEELSFLRSLDPGRFWLGPA